MPIIPNLVERTYMLRLNRGPGPMLDLMSGMALESAMLALELGVFEALADGARTPTGVAERGAIAEAGAQTLLAFLSRAGYVVERRGGYELTAMTETWIRRASEESYAPYFRFWREVLYPFWREHAEDAITNGTPPVTVDEWLDSHPERWSVAQAAFRATAEQIGDDIVDRLDVREGAEVLDVGGGHGRYSVAVCERIPGARATVFDAPEMADIAADTVAEAGLGDRVSFEAGDYERSTFEGSYDLALVFNVVHGNDRATNRSLFQRLAEAVAPGGRIALLDQFADESGASIATTGARFLDLTYLVSLGGRTYHTDSVRSWLADAGFQPTASHEFSDRNMTLLVAAHDR